jgi:hypothetical protein
MSISNKDFDRIKASLETDQTIYFSTNGVNILFQTKILKFDRQSILLRNPVPPQYIRQVKDASEFIVQLPMMRLTSDIIESDGVNIVLPLTHLQTLQESRKEERIIYHSAEGARVEFVNPADNQTKLTKIIMDLSSTGLSMRVPFSSKLYAPGLVIPDLTISIKNKIYNKINGRVKYRRPFLAEKQKLFAQVGIQFER